MVKPTKNKIRIIISIFAAVLLLSLLVVYSGSFRETKVNSNIGNSSRTMGFLTKDTPYEQSFVPASEKLSYIEVRFATYTDDTAAGKIHFALAGSDGVIISESDVAIKDLQDDAYYRFDTNLNLDTAKSYSFTLASVDNGWEKAPVVWVSSSSGQEQTNLVLPGISSSSAYQTNAQYGYSYFNNAAFAGCAFLILLCSFVFILEVEIPEKFRGLAGRVVLLLTPVAMFFLAEALNDNSALTKKLQAYPLNYAYYLLLYLIFFVVINRLRVSMLIANTIIYILSVINYFKLIFRGEPLQPWDIFAFKTALNVSDSYTFQLTVVLIFTFLCFILMNLISWKVDCSVKRIRNRVFAGFASALLAVLLVFSLFGTDRYAVAAFNLMQKIGITNNVWNQTSNYEQNGLVIAFTMNAQYMNVDKPGSYSEARVTEIKSLIESGTDLTSEVQTSTADLTDSSIVPEALQPSLTPSAAAPATDPEGSTLTTTPAASPAAAPTAAPTATPTAAPTAAAIPTPAPSSAADVISVQNQTTGGAVIPAVTPAVTMETVSNPNIIAIMCESYADLTTIADYTTNKEVTPFYDTVSENVIKGSLYVSTYGGGTANSEFEFLTGNTMAFLPTGSIPYQQYLDSSTGSLAQILKGKGYSTIAVHPYRASGWNRESVYSNMGFDAFLSQDDFLNPSYMRGYISDECSYATLIDLYENKEEGQPIFLFNVTMQNHGGYVNKYANFTEDVTLTEFPGEFPETEQYLSLINKSDEALKNLIDYFSEVDEPTVICFFGDHLPNIKNNFYETILGENLTDLTAEEMLKLYQTPFLIWANYDIPEQEIDMISANYLSTLLMQTANIDLPDYNQYLSTLYQNFPVIDAMAVIDSAGNTYQAVSSVPSKEAITSYSILQYNNLFDKSGRDATLFDSTSLTAVGDGVMITGLPLTDASVSPGTFGANQTTITAGESVTPAASDIPVS